MNEVMNEYEGTQKGVGDKRKNYSNTKRTLMTPWAARECRQLDLVKTGLRESSVTLNVNT